jgi:manganese/zinc/iron transport system substrate-binding protein
MLKKVYTILATLSLCGCFFGCQKGKMERNFITSWMSDTGKIKVLSTTAQIADLVVEIGGDRVDSLVLIRGTMDPHSYELVKGDDEKFRRADLLFYNGLGLEHGASLFAWLSTSDKATGIGDRILKSAPNLVLRNGSSIDPHIWMDISLWKEATYVIEEKLSALDHKGGVFYHERAELLRERMDLVHLELRELLAKVPQEKRYLVTSHDAFHYFTRAYLAEQQESDWAERFAAPEGLSPDGQLSPVDIRRIVNYLHKHQVRVMFPESNVSKDSIRKIASSAKELGFEVKICSETLYGDAMDGKDLHYLDMMRHNASVIFRHLEGV